MPNDIILTILQNIFTLFPYNDKINNLLFRIFENNQILNENINNEIIMDYIFDNSLTIKNNEFFSRYITQCIKRFDYEKSLKNLFFEKMRKILIDMQNLNNIETNNKDINFEIWKFCMICKLFNNFLLKKNCYVYDKYPYDKDKQLFQIECEMNLHQVKI